MAINKVVYAGRTLVDLTADTVDAAHLAKGYTAHDASGAAITGTMDGGGGKNYLVNRFAEHDTALEFAADADTCGALTSVGDYAFYECENLASVSLPALTSVGDYAFYECENLASVSLPALTSVGDYAFYYCSKLTSVSLPECTSVGISAFTRCSNLTSVSLPALTSVGANAFSSCSKLTSMSLPFVTSLNGLSFNDCANLVSVSLPAVTSIGDREFYYCSKLTSVSLPECTSVGISAFTLCSNLKVVWCNGSGLDALRSEYSDIGLSSADMLRDASDVVALFADKSAVMASANGATVAVEAFTSDGSTPTITADNGCVVDGTTVTIPASVAGGTTVTITATSGTHSTTATVSVLGADPACIVSGNGFEFDSVDGSGHYVYRSTNYNVNKSVAKAKVTISGNGTYTIHVKNSGEEDCDYFEASALDATDIVRDGSTNVLKAKDIMDDFTATHDYVVSDGGTHSFIVCFSKDEYVAAGLDRAFFYVTKS